jgi:hypothetical protein
MEMRNSYKIMIGKPGGKRPLGRPNRTWEGNRRMNLMDVWWEGSLDASGSGKGPVVGSCESGSEYWGSIKRWGIS